MIRLSMVVALTAAFMSPAGAAVIVTGTTPSTFTVNYGGNIGAQTVPGLTSSIVFKFLGTSLAGTVYNFGYTLTNTSSAPITQSRVSGFAFRTTPNVVSATTSGLFSSAIVKKAAYPNGVKEIDVCMTDGKTCQGGANGGLFRQQTRTGDFKLTFSSAQPQITIDEFFVRYQSIEGTKLASSATGVGVVAASVPEPATWVMMIGGFALVGASLRYRQRTAAKPLTA